MEFDFWEMELGPGDKLSDSFNVSVLGASRQWISQIWRDCRDGGLDCWAVDGAPLTIARAVAMVGGVSGSRRALAVDWGFSNTTLCVVGDGRPLYSRRVHDCAFGRVLDAIMNTFDVTLDEAQHLTETQGMLRPKDEPTPAAHSHQFDPSVVSDADLPFAIAADPAIQAAITDSSAPAVEELVRQIRRTLQFTEAQRRHLHPAAVWLLGGGAAMRNVAPYLSHALHVPVRVWNLAPEAEPIACAAGSRSALFAGAAALSAAAWRAA
jgi:Tfp pilus assembly PilM family ATPase